MVTIDFTPWFRSQSNSSKDVGIPEPANLSSINQEKLVGFFAILPWTFLQILPGLLILSFDKITMFLALRKILKNMIKKLK